MKSTQSRVHVERLLPMRQDQDSDANDQGPGWAELVDKEGEVEECRGWR